MKNNIALISFICFQGLLMNAMEEKSRAVQEQNSALRNAIHNIHTLENLINAGANVNVKDDIFGFTPLHYAAEWKEVAATKALIKAGADVNARDNKRSTPLHKAVSERMEGAPNQPWVDKQVQIVEILIKAGADVNAEDTFWTTPLRIAARTGQVEMVKALVAAGANVNLARGAHTERGLENISALLLATRELISSLRPEASWTPEKLCTLGKNHLEVIKILLDAGANINIGTAGNTPLDDILKIDPKHRDIIVLFVTAISPKDIQHVIPAIIALTKKPNNLCKDIGSLIAAQLIPEIVNEKLAFARKYLPNVPEAELRQAIIASINRVIAKSPRIQPAKQEFVAPHTKPKISGRVIDI